jgi:hypothetical protein
MLPRRINDLVNAAARHDSLICTGFYVERDGRRRVFGSTERQITLNELFHYNIVGNQALVRRVQFMAIGGFDVNLPASEDYDLWTRVVDHCGTGFRINPISYIKRELPCSGQITGTSNFAIGARKYAAKYFQRMSAAQRRSQRLICRLSEGTPIRMREVFDLLTFETSPMLMKRLIKQGLLGLK